MRAPAAGSDVAAQRAFHRELLSRSSALPGVVSAGLSYHVPGGRGGSWGRIVVEGEQPEGLDQELVRINPQHGPYLETLGLRSLAGELLSGDEDDDSAPVVVLNQTAAARFFRLAPDG